MEKEMSELPPDSSARLLDTTNGASASKIEIRAPKSDESAAAASKLLGGITPPPDQHFRAYGWRWYVLAVVMLLNGSNAFSWIGYAPVANFVDRYYEWPEASNWLSMVFLIAAVPIAFFAMWSVRIFGLRSAILVAGVANGLGAVARLCSSLPGLDPFVRVVLVLGGQAVAAMAYPFIMFLPTKVSASWFPAEQRVLATTLMTLSNPLGVLLANLISPQLVTEVWMVSLLNLVTFVPSAVGGLMAVFGVCSSEPPTPPSASASTSSLPFFQGLRRIMTSRNYWWLLLALGGGIGMFNALYTVMQQMLCPKGYSNSFSGLCCILMIVGGIVGATMSGRIVDKTGLFEETLKVAFCLAVLSGILLAQLALLPDIAPAIAINCFLFGVFGLAAYPLGLELSAECTYPVTETTSTGFIVLSGQIQGAAYIALLTMLSKPLTENTHLEVCSKTSTSLIEAEEIITEKGVAAKDMTLSLIVFSGVAASLAVIFTIFFRPKLRRRNMEQQRAKTANGESASKDTTAVTSLKSDPTTPNA